jgi:hypothetical protein
MKVYKNYQVDFNFLLLPLPRFETADQRKSVRLEPSNYPGGHTYLLKNKRFR